MHFITIQLIHQALRDEISFAVVVGGGCCRKALCAESLLTDGSGISGGDHGSTVTGFCLALREVKWIHFCVSHCQMMTQPD